jgi:hypothetical protein
LDPTQIPLHGQAAEFFRPNSGILRLIRRIAAEFLYPQDFLTVRHQRRGSAEHETIRDPPKGPTRGGV